MRFPLTLRQAIDDELSQHEPAVLARASAHVTDRYKAGDFTRAPLDSPAARLAYARVRMPATFAANAHVFGAIAAQAPSLDIRSMLDLGAGPGTSMWAAAEIFPSIQRFTLVERDRELADFGRRLAFHGSTDAVRSARWDNRDLNSLSDLEPHDLVVFSYVLGELPAHSFETTLRSAWMKARHLLVIIEPGTPRHFARLIASRLSCSTPARNPLLPVRTPPSVRWRPPRTGVISPPASNAPPSTAAPSPPRSVTRTRNFPTSSPPSSRCPCLPPASFAIR